MEKDQYQVMGGDGNDYGPVNARKIRQWIKEERLEKKTPVKFPGAKDWVFLGTLPEFKADFEQNTEAVKKKTRTEKLVLLTILVVLAGVIYLALKKFNPH